MGMTNQPPRLTSIYSYPPLPVCLFGPSLTTGHSSIRVAPFPYELYGVTVPCYLEQLELLLRQQCPPTDVACMVLVRARAGGGEGAACLRRQRWVVVPC